MKRNLGILALLAGVAVIIWMLTKPASPTGKDGPNLPSTSGAPSPLVAEASVRMEFHALAGKWMREDGGYVLEIHKANPDGTLQAAYFNPRPISVFKATASRDGSLTKVFVELRDTGYPGCTYELTYVPGIDQLAGKYYQAAMQQYFEVTFQRLKADTLEP